MYRLPPPARLGAALLSLVGLSAVFIAVPRKQPTLLDAFAREVRTLEVDGVRLSITTEFRPCHGEAAPAPPAADEGCGGASPPPSRGTIDVIRRAGRAASTTADADALHAAALADLVFADPEGKRLEAAISSLQSASLLEHRPARVLADLSAAHLLRAERQHTSADLLEALEAAERALEWEPANLAARFNAATALDRIGLRREAAREWARYRGEDSTSAWGVEAGRRLRTLSAAARRLPQPPRSAPPAALARYAAASPQQAGALAWDTLLSEWGFAVLDGDTATARARLEQAAAIGEALAARGGDASLADEVREIRRHPERSTASRQIAAAHAAFAAGRAANDRSDFPGARREFERVLAGRPPRPLREWAETYRAVDLFYERPTGAPAALEKVAREADAGRYPAMAGRRWWALGSARGAQGSYDDALAALQRAIPLLERAGELEYAAAALTQVGYVQALLGTADGGYPSLHRSVLVVHEHPGTLSLHNALYALANAAAADGLHRAALRVRNEAVGAAGEMALPQYLAEARLARARERLATGGQDIDADVLAAIRTMKELDVPYPSSWLQADFLQTRAEAALTADPVRAAADLDSVAAYFARRRVPEREVAARFEAAAAKLQAGRQGAADADLRRAVAVLDTQRTQVGSARLRASLLEESRRVFDRAVMLSVREGRVDRALDYLEQSRASYSPAGRAAGWNAQPVQTRRGEVGVEIALIGDTLLAWTVSGREVRFARETVRRAELMREVERVRAAMERRAPEPVLLPPLESLYDRLIGPLKGRLGPAGTPLVIVADGELSALPIAALRDRERGRYLMQDHAVRFASSLREPARLPVPPAPGTPVTLVADPAFDRHVFPELQPLRGAAAEVAALRGRYPGARVLGGPRADVSALRDAFLRGGIAHFAGHARFDDARPERSFLVAAPGGGADRLTAADIERMELGGLRLVVLSACQTSRAQAGRSGGFAGLAGAFLAAGAGGVVGSLWQVDDADTRGLMERFHRAYAASGDAAGALRQAQEEMLRSGASPAAWAGFRYAGG